MDVSEEGQNVEVSKANASDPMSIDGPSNLMAIEPRNAAGKVNLKALQDRIRREKEQIALRNTSYSGGVASGSSSAPAQLTQQHAAPATLSETGTAAVSIPSRVVQSIASTNTASELREARLGKRAVSRVAQEEVSAPASIASSPAATKTEDGTKSETSLSTDTPTSTLPSSTSSTAPSSPLPVPNLASQAPTDVSSTSDLAHATTVKRKLPVKGTDAGKAETHQTSTSPAPLPTAGSPVESSKKARSKPPPPKTDAASEDEVAPLSDIPDDKGRKFSPLKQMFHHNLQAFGLQRPIPIPFSLP